MKKKINHPDHYNKGGIEVISFLDAWEMNFNRGSAIKYICRAGIKDLETEIEDLGKAAWYINHEIKRLINLRIDKRKNNETLS